MCLSGLIVDDPREDIQKTSADNSPAKLGERYSIQEEYGKKGRRVGIESEWRI